MAILATVFVVLAITLIPALKSTISQQGQINALQDRIVKQRETVTTLQQEQQRWKDPAYVEQQARQRLKFVRVGERSFTVIDGEVAPDLTGGAEMAAPEKAAAANTPWYGQLWQSMVIADTRTSASSPSSSGSVSPAPGVP